MNILLADDDRNFGIILKSELAEEGYTVDLVNDGVEAVLNCIDRPYQLVLLDIMMPKLDGINAMKIIKKLNPALPVIVFSGNVGQVEMEEAAKAGAQQCFSKPFEISDLKNCIKQSLN